MCERSDSVRGWSFVFEDGFREDIPDNIIHRSSTLCNSIDTSVEGDGTFTVAAPSGCVRTWLECAQKLFCTAASMGVHGLCDTAENRLIDYIKVSGSV